MNTAIITAAGQGTRIGGKRAKQFLKLAGVPIIIHTLRRFESCACIQEIIVTLPSTDTASFLELANKHGLRKVSRVVQGGATRAESVWNGLKAVRAVTAEIIAVHDGVRPFVTTEEISLTVQKAKETGAAILAAPVTDTIKEVESETIVRTHERSKLWRALTPQCFRYDILRRAFENALDKNLNATDDSAMVEAIGVSVSIVKGNPRNIKITHKEDLAVAELLLMLRDGNV
jgi:2-C-methyl-D-erythritol 4-phosphate cytidylyltransferase